MRPSFPPFRGLPTFPVPPIHPNFNKRKADPFEPINKRPVLFNQDYADVLFSFFFFLFSFFFFLFSFSSSLFPLLFKRVFFFFFCVCVFLCFRVKNIYTGNGVVIRNIGPSSTRDSIIALGSRVGKVKVIKILIFFLSFFLFIFFFFFFGGHLLYNELVFPLP